MPTAHARLLKKAVEILGSEKRVVLALDIDLHELRAYMEGTHMPNKNFIEALDIMADSEPG